MPDTVLDAPVIKTMEQLFADITGALQGQKPPQNSSRRSFESLEAWQRWKARDTEQA